MEKDFFSNILPMRRSFEKIEYLKINLKPDEPEAFLLMFYDMLYVGRAVESVKNLIQDELLCPMSDFAYWLEEFGKHLLKKDEIFFMANSSNLCLAKKIFEKYINQSLEING